MTVTLDQTDTADVSVSTSADVPADPADSGADTGATASATRPADDERAIPLDRLLPSPDNVRTLRPKRDRADAELVASILSRGLLENLVVVPAEGRDGWFEVVAGERRRLAHLCLAKDGKIAPDTPVRCLVRSREQAVADSLAENVVRKAMHPAETYRAFARLVDEGETEQGVARQFGIPVAEVRRHLRIGGLHPTLLGHFERDRMTFDAVLAYAGTGDTALQFSAFERLGRRPEASAAEVRRAIRGDRVPSSAGIVTFAGLAAYRREGGRTEKDLFEGTTELLDIDLLRRIARARLETLAATRAEGWAWCIAEMPEAVAPSRYHRVERSVVGVPEDLTARLDALNAREAELEAIDYDDATPEQNDEYDETLEAIAAIEDTIREEYTVVDEATRRFAGCLVTFDATTGEPVVHEGLQRPEDRAAQRAAVVAVAGGVAGEGDEGDGGPSVQAECDEPAAPAVSTALSRDLGRYRRAAVRATLAGAPAVATMLLHYHLCESALGDYRGGRRLFALGGTPDTDETTRDDLESTDAFARLGTVRERLDVSWLDHAGHDARYAAFAALSRARREALVAYCVALQLDAGSGEGDALPETAAAALTTDVASLWRPTAANYFGRLRRDALVELGVEWYGETFRAQAGAATKGSIVERFERLFHGPADDLTDAERAVRATWLPVEMREATGERNEGAEVVEDVPS